MLFKLWNHFSSRRQKQLIVMQIFAVIVSFFEMLSLGAVIPFLGVLANPQSVFDSRYLEIPIIYLGITEPSQLVLPITFLFVLLTILSAGFRLIALWMLTRISQQAGADLSIKIYRNTLFQDYAVHVARNSSEVINGIIVKTNTVTKGVITPTLSLISTLIMMIGIVAVLLLVNIFVTLTAFFSFGLLYLLVMHLTRKNLSTNSARIASKSDLMVKTLQEGLEGIREVLLNSNQLFYVKLYRDADLIMRQATWRNEMIYSSPRFIMEASGIAIVALFAYFATLQFGGINEFLPILGVFVLGAQKLLPAIQKAYASYSRIKGAAYSLEDVIDLLDQPLPKYANFSANLPIPFTQSIELKNLSFRYSHQSPWVLKNLNFKIPKGSVVGIIGSTGCGKSTIIDLIMGLLPLTNGELTVDGVPIDNENKREWQANISCVPQDIYLSDGTIKENIAFGLPKEQINFSKVKIAAQKAQIAELIESWDDQFETMVGERGMRLSGGQRQRIGVARALYSESNVLILDEATSALDNETELAVMNSINTFNKDITVIIIAHRLTTLKKCDMILELGNNFQTKIMDYSEIINLNIKPGDKHA
ncbi:ABC transporter ATP-binding protein/permease [Gammaproteobacteria bacterium]|nr:ABC transporter ATP-binding protein/permease [Gammaproteobacteria bacterium]